MKTYYAVCMQYKTEVNLETPNLLEAVRYACAVSMHSGRSTQIYRMNYDSDKLKTVKSALMSVNPQQYDYRQMTAATAIGMKAMAHELITNIDEVVPEGEKQGFAE